MNRMIYTKNRQEPTVLYRGVCNGYSFAIVSFGTHPCAYVAVPRMIYLTYRLLPPIAVHGAITYTNFCPDLDGAWSIGWDYGHSGDYNGREHLSERINKHGKKWTTEEIMQDVESVIQQLPDVEKYMLDKYSNPEKLSEEIANRLIKAFKATISSAMDWRNTCRHVMRQQ